MKSFTFYAQCEDMNDHTDADIYCACVLKNFIGIAAWKREKQIDRQQKPDYLRKYSRGFLPDSVFAHNPECNKPSLV
jgi:hypothetical protein